MLSALSMVLGRRKYMRSRVAGSQKGGERAKEGWSRGLWPRLKIAPFACRGSAMVLMLAVVARTCFVLLPRILHLRAVVSRSFFEAIEGYGKAEEHAPSGTTRCASSHRTLELCNMADVLFNFQSFPQQHNSNFLRRYRLRGW